MNMFAVLFVLASAVLHAGWNILGKSRAHADMSFLGPLLWGALFLTPVAIRYGSHLWVFPPAVWLLVLGAGFFQALYFGGLTAAYRRGDLSLAYPLIRALPVLFVTLFTTVAGMGTPLGVPALGGILLVTGASFVLPLQGRGRPSLDAYTNRLTLFALIAAIGTTGYSIIDDQALRILRAPDVLGTAMPVIGISLLYLWAEALTAVIWLLMYQGVLRLKNGSRGAGRPRTETNLRIAKKHFVTQMFIGLMIYSTYGLVLIAMAYATNVSYIVAFRQASLPIGVILGILLFREAGGWGRVVTTIVLTAGLILVGIG